MKLKLAENVERAVFSPDVSPSDLIYSAVVHDRQATHKAVVELLEGI